MAAEAAHARSVAAKTPVLGKRHRDHDFPVVVIVPISVRGNYGVRERMGKGVVFLSLEDETGIGNVVVWPSVYERTRGVVRTEPYLVLDGVVQLRSGAHNVIVSDVRPLERVPGGLFPAPNARHVYPPAGPDVPMAERPATPTRAPDRDANDPAVIEARSVAPAAHSFR